MARQLYDYDGNPAGGGKFVATLTTIGMIIVVAIAVAMYLGIAPTRLTTSGLAPQPTADTTALDTMRDQVTRLEAQLRAARAAADVAPIVVQNVPQGEAPQPVVIPQPAPVAQSVDAPAVAPAQKPVVIILHQGYQQPVITGSGACAAAKGARRCGK